MTEHTGPHGKNLTGQVKILTYPGQNYLWRIGYGALTDVFKGELRQLGAPAMLVAVKIFRVSSNDDAKRIQDTNRRLTRESELWLGLDHPNIHPYLGHCVDLGMSVALISSFCAHATIMKYLFRNPSANRLKLVRDVAKGIQYLHSKNIIHADLQRNNVLIDDFGNARLCDFGRSKVIGDAKYRTSLLAGCIPYMAPELLPIDDRNVDELFTLSSDVYAFGMLAFEIFTDSDFVITQGAVSARHVMSRVHEGKRPERSSDTEGRISDAAWNTLQACWVHDPTLRPTADEVVQRMV